MVLFASLFFSMCCKDEPTQPPPDGNDTVSRRDYVFTIDTLAYPDSPQTYLMSIWGSSPKDVWAVGHNPNGFANIYHYDGTRWTQITAFPPLPFGVSYRCVTGFGPNDVYLVGLKEYWKTGPNGEPVYSDSSLVVHYDGVSWQVMDTPPGGDGLLKIWGSSSQNLWACGYDGTLLRYDGVKWTDQSYDTTQIFVSIFGFGTGELYSIGSRYLGLVGLDTATYYFNVYKNGSWIKEDTMVFTNPYYSYGFGHMGMWGTGSDNLYTIGPRVYKHIGNSWQSQVYSDYLFNDIRGTSTNNIFAVGDHGLIQHYNGKEWWGIEDYRQTIVRFLSVQPFDKEIFVLGFYNNQSYVIHGKLK